MSLSNWKPRVACLIGNGFSIPYSKRLAVPELTKALVEEFETLAGGPVQDALAEFSKSFHGFQDNDFEALLTPIESVGIALEHLNRLKGLADSAEADLTAALDVSANFCREAYRVGLGTTLQLISQACADQGDELFHQEKVVEPCRRISELKSFGPITVATLNYDGLLHSGFLDCLGPALLDDLSAGYDSGTLMPDGKTPLECHALRETPNLRSGTRVHLLNLHGSLGWLEDPSTTRVWKFQLEDLRDCSYWSHFTAGKTDLKPMVVLTNRKQERVKEAPFSLAYSIFETRLMKAEHWLVAGYSLSDEPLNAVFRRAWDSRAMIEKPPRVLVLARGNDLAQTKTDVKDKLGISEDHLYIDLTGMPSSIGGDIWSEWKW